MAEMYASVPVHDDHVDGADMEEEKYRSQGGRSNALVIATLVFVGAAIFIAAVLWLRFGIVSHSLGNVIVGCKAILMYQTFFASS